MEGDVQDQKPSSKPRRVLQGVRAIAAATCLIACVLLALLWVRSYWYLDNVIGPARGSFRLGVASANGWLTLRYANGSMGPEYFPKWNLQTTTNEQLEKVYQQMEQSIKGTPGATFTRPDPPRFRWMENWGVQFPYWLPTLTVAILAIAFGWRLRWQYGLRALFVTTTIIAVGIGLLVAFFRSQQS
jgi:hypothetical protein